MSLKNNKHLTSCTLTDQGAQRIEFAEFSSFKCKIQQSIMQSEKLLWLGTLQDPMCLDRDRVSELISVLQTWLDTGKLVEEGI